MRGVPATPFFMCVSEFLFLEQCLDSVTQELLTFRMGHLCPIFHMHRKNSHEPVTFTLVQRMRMVLPDLGTLLRAPPWWDHPTPDWRSELARPLSAIYTAGCLVREACATAPARAAAPVVCVGSTWAPPLSAALARRQLAWRSRSGWPRAAQSSRCMCWRAATVDARAGHCAWILCGMMRLPWVTSHFCLLRWRPPGWGRAERRRRLPLAIQVPTCYSWTTACSTRRFIATWVSYVWTRRIYSATGV